MGKSGTAIVTVFATLLAPLLLAGCERSVATPAPPPRPAARAPADPAAPQTPEANGAAMGGAGDQGGSAGGGGSAGAAGDIAPQTPPLQRTMTAGADGKIPQVTWDFREGRSPALVNWPKDQGANNVFALEGDFAFQLKVQDKKDFAGHVRRVESRKKGGEIEGVEITAPPESTEQAYTRAKTMLTQLGFGQPELAKLQAWRENAKTGNFDNLELKRTNSYNRSYTVRVVNDGTSEQPWSVGLDVDWSNVCECHG